MEIWPDEGDSAPLHSKVSGFMVEMARAEMDLPHIVFSRDARGFMASFSGPYPTAVEALVAADIEEQIERETDGAQTLTFHIAALYPALSVGVDED
jgi:hypothetical protein